VITIPALEARIRELTIQHQKALNLAQRAEGAVAVLQQIVAEEDRRVQAEAEAYAATHVEVEVVGLDEESDDEREEMEEASES
tara:strand:+ start:356 stop:604 length:249 start_codon:yes stop_codon:yes gene_type:complete